MATIIYKPGPPEKHKTTPAAPPPKAKPAKAKG
jgi:hypothetical protein